MHVPRLPITSESFLDVPVTSKRSNLGKQTNIRNLHVWIKVDLGRKIVSIRATRTTVYIYRPNLPAGQYLTSACRVEESHEDTMLI